MQQIFNELIPDIQFEHRTYVYLQFLDPKIYALDIFITFGKNNFKQLLKSFLYLIIVSKSPKSGFHFEHLLPTNIKTWNDIYFFITHK